MGPGDVTCGLSPLRSLVVTFSDQNTDRADQSGVSRRLGTLDMASAVLIQFALWAVENDNLQ